MHNCFLIRSFGYLPIFTSQKPKYQLRFIYWTQAPVNLQMKIKPPIKRPSASVDFDNPIGNSNSTVDLFSMLSIDDDKTKISTTPPSWTTFDCKITLLVFHFFWIFYFLSFIWFMICTCKLLNQHLCLQDKACELFIDLLR